MIASGEYKPGDQLPTELELAGRFQVSRSSVREALRTLVGIGAVEVRRGHGVYVKDIQANDLINPSLLRVLLTPAHTEQLLESRLVVEPALAAYAAQRSTEEDYQRMDKFLRDYQNAVQEHKAVSELSATFHLHVALMAKSPLLCHFVESLLRVLAARGELIDNYPGFKEWEYGSHYEIYEIIKRRDSEKASEVMKQHLLDSASWYLGAVSPPPNHVK